MKSWTELSDYQDLNSEVRPWGNFREIYKNNFINVKIIEVNPESRLSLQSHKKREEHWIVQEGIATVTVNDDTFELGLDEHIHIPVGAIHRLENKSPIRPLKIVEIQQGTYFGEDDIVRYQDDYNRI